MLKNRNLAELEKLYTRAIQLKLYNLALSIEVEINNRIGCLEDE